MAIKLRDGELIKTEANFHWSAFIFAKFLAGFGVLMLISTGIALFANASTDTSVRVSGVVWSIVFFIPFLYKWLQNKFKKYIVTNQRVYLEVGILSKSTRDLPLNKINDVSMKQGILQRIFGSGTIVILTGNDKPTIIPEIDSPDEFKNAISEMVEKRVAS